MVDGDPRAAWRYHDATKHSAARLQGESYELDWDAEPIPYKLYAGDDSMPLPRDWAPSSAPALTALAAGGSVTSSPGAATATSAGRVPTLADLARLLLLSAGITRKVIYANGREQYFRAAACTGALYHVDLYVVCGALAGLDAGVYHFGPHDFALRRLRAGDYRNVLLAATADEPAIAAAAAVIVSVSTVWRNAWKYRARAYRHCWWDDGTVLANALAAAAAVELPARVVLGFVDAAVDRLLGLEVPRELGLSLLAIGHDPAPRAAEVPDVPPLAFATVPVGPREVDYPAIGEMHAASALHSRAEVTAWRVAVAGTDAAAPRVVAPSEDAVASAIGDAGDATVPVRSAETIDAVIRRRGSTRAFARAPIALEDLSTILAIASAGLDCDVLPRPSAHRAELYLIVHAVDGVEAGTYAFRRAEQRLERLRSGDFRRQAGFLALGQDLAADASVNCYVLVDLHRTLDELGARGYRAAQLEAAIRGGRMYLAAYALGLGATGLTFFDDAVTDFFAPETSASSVMFLIAIGRRRTRVRR